MALCDYALCHNCQGKAFYDANISDPGYCATWDPSEESEPIDLAVLCSECAKSHVAIIVPRHTGDMGICRFCMGTGEDGPDQVCAVCEGNGADTEKEGKDA